MVPPLALSALHDGYRVYRRIARPSSWPFLWGSKCPVWYPVWVRPERFDPGSAPQPLDNSISGRDACMASTLISKQNLGPAWALIEKKQAAGAAARPQTQKTVLATLIITPKKISRPKGDRLSLTHSAPFPVAALAIGPRSNSTIRIGCGQCSSPCHACYRIPCGDPKSCRHHSGPSTSGMRKLPLDCSTSPPQSLRRPRCAELGEARHRTPESGERFYL